MRANFMKRVGVIVVLIIGMLVAVGTGVWTFWSSGDKTPIFRTVAVKRGDLVATISATGTVEPIAAVDVGARVAGVIIAFGKDKTGKPLNLGSVVK